MKAFKVLTILLLAMFGFSAANAQVHHRRSFHKRHHVIVRHHKPYHHG